MTGWVRLPPFVVLTLFLGTANAIAQSAGADEAITSHGTVTQTVGLTLAQKSAIYNAIVRQRVRASSTQIQATVGASVSRSVPLARAARSNRPRRRGIPQICHGGGRRGGCRPDQDACCRRHSRQHQAMSWNFRWRLPLSLNRASAQSALKTNNIVKSRHDQRRAASQ